MMGVVALTSVLCMLGIRRTALTDIIGPDGGSIMMLVLATVLSILGVGWVVLILMSVKERVGSEV